YSDTETVVEPPITSEESAAHQDLSLDELRIRGDKALFAKDFDEAIQYYRRGQELSPHDEYFTHQLCIATYRQPYNSVAEAMQHYQAAEDILQRLHPETSTHPETLGLMGSINKRKFEVSPKPEYLTTAIQFYSRGFSLNHNYYNGINLAYMHIQQAVVSSSARKANASWYSAEKIWDKILSVTTDLLELEDQKRTNSKHWILQARAQAYLGLGQLEAFEETSKQALAATSNEFSTDMYKQYNQRLKDMLEVLRERFPEG
ncbi:MAG TPA: hypothetical protein DCE41_06705, partial [Cytophagales bacterium]|nr:hypothetical protein [Cytophagales bacterium]